MTEERALYQTDPADVARYAEPIRRMIEQFHRGRKAAIPAREIGRLLGITPRPAERVRQVIHKLWEQDVPIGAAVSKPPGFFWLTSDDEARAYLENLLSRYIGTRDTYNVVSRMAYRTFKIPIEQMKLDL